jgi:oligopeptide/dipeptide ABC transporter ATP-binding protein
METKPLLSVSELSKSFAVRRGVVQAVRHVSFEIAAGETVGLVGESGCGKSTLGRTILRLYPVDGGKILLDGVDISHFDRKTLRPFRRRMQMIFQDPYASLNPRKTAGKTIEVPLIVHGVGTAPERKERVRWLMSRVGLPAEMADRHPHEFSGGQRQRIGIARALALNPQLIICDEPVSALDVSVQAQVINLLAEIQAEFNLSYLLISHDLSVVAHFAHRVIVMYLGSFVEVAARTDLWLHPLHPYTQALIGAIPVVDFDRSRAAQVLLKGDLPSPLNPPRGCSFHPRCPYAFERCRTEEPELRPAGETDHRVACHRIFPNLR